MIFKSMKVRVNLTFEVFMRAGGSDMTPTIDPSQCRKAMELVEDSIKFDLQDSVTLKNSSFEVNSL